MAVTAKVYGLSLAKFVNAEINYGGDTIKCALLTSTYTPNQDTHEFASSLTNELSGGGYSRQTIGTKSTTYTTSTNALALLCANIAFSALTAADVYYAVFYKDTGSDATSPLISYVSFGAVQSLTAQDLTIAIPATGIVSLTAA